MFAVWANNKIYLRAKHELSIKLKMCIRDRFGYATDLRSQTQGRASYSMEPLKYAEAPTSVAAAVIEEMCIRDSLSNEEFGKHILKKVYPRAVYDKWSKSWEDDDFFIDYDLKDIQTSEGEKAFKPYLSKSLLAVEPKL